MISEYFIGIVTASVVTTLLSMLYPDSGGGVRKALELFLSLTLLCVILAPIGSMIARAREDIDLDISDDIEADEHSAESAIFSSLAQMSQGQIQEKLNELLAEEFGGRIEARAQVSAEGGEVKIESITLILYGSSMWEDPRELRDFVGRFTEAEILIVNGG